jgi:anti-sigma-K factor RskA
LNLSEYISTGILEAYVLGELTSEERSEVERNILLYPELKEELRRIEITQEKWVSELALDPDRTVKERIFKKIGEKRSGSPVLKIPNPSLWLRYSLAASVALMLVSSVLAFRYYYKWKSADSSLNDLLVQNQRIASEYNAVNQRLDKIESDLKITTSPSFKRTIMTGTDNSPESLAFVYWNASTHDVYLSIEKLKELAQSNQYQLWAIVEGKPVDAGVFDPDFSGLLKMKNISNATTFAITIEKRGGAEAPTLETMQVIGNVAKG